MKPFKFISVTFPEVVYTTRKDIVAVDVQLKIEDNFDGKCFEVEAGFGMSPSSESMRPSEQQIEAFRQQVENSMSMEELVAKFNQQLQELGVYKNAANPLPAFYQVEKWVGQSLGVERAHLDSITAHCIEKKDAEHSVLERFYVYSLNGKKGVVSADGVVTPALFNAIDRQGDDGFFIGKIGTETYYVMPDGRLVSTDEDAPAEALHVDPEELSECWWSPLIYLNPKLIENKIGH